MALHVELLSNTRKVYSGLGMKVLLPAQTGIMEVLPHHAPFVVNLAPGTIFVDTDDKKPVKIPITIGVAYKTAENVTILIEETLTNKLK